ncbi:hypothetical protein [Neosynechococcus sphagnicola]|nr:hypothetical protein [Neosynechococcus sphagnicola]
MTHDTDLYNDYRIYVIARLLSESLGLGELLSVKVRQQAPDANDAVTT